MFLSIPDALFLALFIVLAVRGFVAGSRANFY